MKKRKVIIQGLTVGIKNALKVIQMCSSLHIPITPKDLIYSIEGVI